MSEELQAAAAPVGGNAEGLLLREPLGWDAGSIPELFAWLGRLPAELAHALSELFRSPEGLAVIATLALAGLLHLLVDRRRGEVVGAVSERLAGRPGPRSAAALTALASVLMGAAVPLLLWGSLAGASALAGGMEHALRLGAQIARLYAVVTVLWLAYRSVLAWQVFPLRTKEAFRLATAAWATIGYVVLMRVLIVSGRNLGAPKDVVALLQFAFLAGLGLILFVLLLNRRMVLGILPKVQEPAFLWFLKWAYRLYYPALVFTLAVATLRLLGFARLAGFLMLRSWALVGLFLGVVYLDHLLTAVITRLLAVGQDDTAPENLQLARSAIRLLRFLEAVALLLLVPGLLDLADDLVEVLSAPLFSLLGRPISLLSAGEALVLFAGIILALLLLLRILESRVYPRLGVDPGTGAAISTSLKYLLGAAGALTALETLGLDPTALTVFAGAVGIGAGLGLQRLASNLASGLTIVFGRVVRRGDVVTVDGNLGLIREVGLRSTTLRDMDNVELIVPNDNLINETIINWTYSDPLVRLHVPLGVSYGSDPEEVRRLLLEIAAEHPEVRARPAPGVWFVGFGDSSLDFELLVWMNIKRITRKQLASDLYFAAFRAFKEHGIEIPFPQRDLHLKSGWPSKPTTD